MNHRSTALLLSIAIAVFPLSASFMVHQDDPTLYEFKAHIIEGLDSPYTVYQYMLAEPGEGKRVHQDSQIVLVINKILTEGGSNFAPEKNNEIWIQGRLLTEDYLCERHAQFPEYTHIYVLQIKNGVFWPDQIAFLKAVYTSPVTSLPVPSYIWFYFLFQGPWGRTPKMNVILFLKAISVYVAVFLIISNYTKKWKIIVIVLAYALLMMILTVPELLY